MQTTSACVPNGVNREHRSKRATIGTLAELADPSVKSIGFEFGASRRPNG
jgi:hypothetical protein